MFQVSAHSHAAKEPSHLMGVGGEQGRSCKGTVGGETGAGDQVLEGTRKRGVSSPDGNGGGLGSAVPGRFPPPAVF